MSWTHGLRRVSELAWEALSTGRCAWESVGDVQLDRRGHVEHVWALGQRRPEENRKSKAACVMSSCGGGGFRSHKASYLSWRHARASKSGSALSRSMRRARARGRPRMMSHFVSHRHATRQQRYKPTDESEHHTPSQSAALTAVPDPRCSCGSGTGARTQHTLLSLCGSSHLDRKHHLRAQRQPRTCITLRCPP